MTEWEFITEGHAVWNGADTDFVKLDGDMVVTGRVVVGMEHNHLTEIKVPKAVFLKLLGAEAFTSGFHAGQSANVTLALANVAGLLACLAALSDDARAKLWDKMHELYCRHCGSASTEKHPVCHCENDE